MGMKYSVMFQVGDEVEVQLAPAALQTSWFKRYHGLTATVISDGEGRRNFPDEEGLVRVRWPFPYMNDKGQFIQEGFILHGNLRFLGRPVSVGAEADVIDLTIHKDEDKDFLDLD